MQDTTQHEHTTQHYVLDKLALGRGVLWLVVSAVAGGECCGWWCIEGSGRLKGLGVQTSNVTLEGLGVQIRHRRTRIPSETTFRYVTDGLDYRLQILLQRLTRVVLCYVFV